MALQFLQLWTILPFAHRISSLACTTLAHCRARSLATIRLRDSRRAWLPRQTRCITLAARGPFDADTSREERKARDASVKSRSKMWVEVDVVGDTRCAVTFVSINACAVLDHQREEGSNQPNCALHPNAWSRDPNVLPPYWEPLSSRIYPSYSSTILP